MFNQNPGSYPNNFGQMQPQYPQFGRGFRGPAPNYNQFVPSTNKQFVRSLEEALSLPADFNSQNIYFDVNNDVMYDICTNGRGEKSWAIFDIKLRQNTAVVNSNSAPDLEERFSKLENKVEELINGKHNVEQTNTSNE